MKKRITLAESKVSGLSIETIITIDAAQYAQAIADEQYLSDPDLVWSHDVSCADPVYSATVIALTGHQAACFAVRTIGATPGVTRTIEAGVTGSPYVYTYEVTP